MSTNSFNLVSHTLALGLIKLTVVAFLKFFLQIKDLVFKCKLVDFVFSFKSKDLIVSVLTKALTIVSSSVCYLDL